MSGLGICIVFLPKGQIKLYSRLSRNEKKWNITFKKTLFHLLFFFVFFCKSNFLIHINIFFIWKHTDYIPFRYTKVLHLFFNINNFMKRRTQSVMEPIRLDIVSSSSLSRLPNSKLEFH